MSDLLQLRHMKEGDMKWVGIVAALLLVTAGGVTLMIYRGGADVSLQRPSERTVQNAGESTAGRSQEMPASQAADNASADASGERARTVQRTGSGNVALSPQQRQAIAGYFANAGNTPKVDPAQISVSVGASVPRQIALQALPQEVLQITERYHGDEYALTADSLIIVEPKSRRIVAIIPLSG
jgi:hypothetical protein